MAEWVDIELNKKLFKNVDETALTSTFGALENCFVTESNGISRFPGLKEVVNLGGVGEIHINKYNNDMIAVGSDGRTFRINSRYQVTEVKGIPVLGGDRVSFARTRDGLLMAAGQQVIRYDGEKNNLLSKDAPMSSFVGYIDGYALAVEKGSGRFHYSKINEIGEWPGLNVNAVDGLPDNINAMLITPFNEILFTGEESIEQYERYPGGDAPFFRRWSIGDGIAEPWTLTFADNAAWGLNSRYEFSRLSGQTSQSVSDDIQRDIEHKYSLENIGAFEKAWAAPINIKGQKFIVLQSPLAHNMYGTEGFTGIFDIRRGSWCEIYSWDRDNGIPALWDGRSVFNIWGKTFIGGNGRIYQLDPLTYTNNQKTQRVYLRTAHYDSLGAMRIERLRLTLKRGVGDYTKNPKIVFRSNPDNKGFGRTQIRELGRTGADMLVIEFGAQGIADTWQFEIAVTDDCPFEIRRLQAEVTQVMR